MVEEAAHTTDDGTSTVTSPETGPALPRPRSAAWVVLTGIAWYQQSRLRAWHHRRGARCRFIPTCSEYGSRAVAKYGAVKGITLTVRRIYRCSSGYQGPYVDFP